MIFHDRRNPVIPCGAKGSVIDSQTDAPGRSICRTCFILMAVKCSCRIMLPAIKSKKVKNYLQQKQIKMLGTKKLAAY